MEKELEAQLGKAELEEVVLEEADLEEIELEEAELEEFEEMSPRKRAVVRIVSVVLFLLLVTAVVLFTDYFLEIIKNFIAGFMNK